MDAEWLKLKAQSSKLKINSNLKAPQKRRVGVACDLELSLSFEL
jgi:hypothetical protein